jgi:NAD(P)-dependent dehydrogenase (short-subunit alcohol dehydrogenase family)
MDIDIAGKVILVTGAGRGIGRTLAAGIAAEGARTAILTRSKEDGSRVAAEIGAQDGAGPVLPVVADVTDEDAVAAAVQSIDAEWGRLDAVVHNAGRIAIGHRVVDTDAAWFRSVIDTNLTGAFLVTKHAAPLMVRGGGGRIVYLSSIAGVQTGAGGSAYGASKAGLNILNNVVHQELANDGIRTAAIIPGLTESPGMRDAAPDEHIAHVAARYPGGRIGQPEDLVPLTIFLCSDGAQHISGTTIPVRPFTG